MLPFVVLFAALSITLSVALFFVLRRKKPKVIYVEKNVEEEYKNKLEEEYRNRLEKEYLSKAAIMEKELLTQYGRRSEELNESLSKLKEAEVLRQSAFEEEWNARRKAAFDNLEKELKVYEEQYESKKSKITGDIAALEEQAAAQIESIKDTINDWKSRQDAAIEGFKSLHEIENAESHHKIIFTEEEEMELKELRAAIKRLKNPMPFYKAIHDIYFKNKVNDLILRVVGPQRVSGIYKITHFPSGKTYIGQSVDIGNRWKQHIKRGCGADVLTSNKLYPAMLSFGVEQFMFEIVEVIEDVSKLSEAEKYWQIHFKSIEFGFSMK